MDPAGAGAEASIGNPRLSVMRRAPLTTACASSARQLRTHSRAVAPRGTSTGVAFTKTRTVSVIRLQLDQRGQNQVAHRGHECGGRNRDEPRPDDPAGDAP